MKLRRSIQTKKMTAFDSFVDDTATSSWLMDDENYDTEIVSHQLLLARQRKKQFTRYTLSGRENSVAHKFEDVKCGNEPALKDFDVVVGDNDDTGDGVASSLLRKTENNVKKKKKRKMVKENDDKNSAAKRRLFVYPIRVTEKERDRHVNLLLHSADGKCHYSAIRNFSANILNIVNEHTTVIYVSKVILHRNIFTIEKITRACKSMSKNVAESEKKKFL